MAIEFKFLKTSALVLRKKFISFYYLAALKICKLLKSYMLKTCDQRLLAHFTKILSFTFFIFSILSDIYPSGSKCEAVRLGVHLILLYFIRILVVGTEIIFLFGCWCGCWCWCGWRTFFVFKSLNNNMVYSLGIYILISKRISCRTKFLWV